MTMRALSRPIRDDCPPANTAPTTAKGTGLGLTRQAGSQDLHRHSLSGLEKRGIGRHHEETVCVGHAGLVARALSGEWGRSDTGLVPGEVHADEFGSAGLLGVASGESRPDDRQVGVGVAKGTPKPRSDELQEADLRGDGIPR